MCGKIYLRQERYLFAPPEVLPGQQATDVAGTSVYSRARAMSIFFARIDTIAGSIWRVLCCSM